MREEGGESSSSATVSRYLLYIRDAIAHRSRQVLLDKLAMDVILVWIGGTYFSNAATALECWPLSLYSLASMVRLLR